MLFNQGKKKKRKWGFWVQIKSENWTIVFNNFLKVGDTAAKCAVWKLYWPYHIYLMPITEVNCPEWMTKYLSCQDWLHKQNILILIDQKWIAPRGFDSTTDSQIPQTVCFLKHFLCSVSGSSPSLSVQQLLLGGSIWQVAAGSVG